MRRLALLLGAMAGLRRLARDRRANAMVEFALAAPALMLFIFGIIQVGNTLWLQNALDYSTAVAARCASLTGPYTSGGGNTSTTCTTVTSYAANQSGSTLASADFVYDSAAGCGCQVTGSHFMALDIPWTNLSVTLTSQACYQPPPKKNCVS
jgi:Flp pilus assembly protein TadG